MKKIFILAIAVFTGICGFAQRNATTHLQPINGVDQYRRHGNTNGKSAMIGSKDTLSNIADTATLVLYTVGSSDSGYVTGTNIWNDMAFAERYDFNGGADSSVQVIGVLAQFGGTVNPVSTQTINFNVWDVNTFDTVRASAYTLYSPFPNNIIDSFAVPVTQLGIGATKDTMKVHLFSSATVGLSGSFYIGYSVNYNFLSPGGAVFGLASSRNGDRTSKLNSLYLSVSAIGDSAIDTVINVQNATMFSDLNWYDNYTQNGGFDNDLAIYPIVIVAGPTSVNGVTRNNLTFFGNYPNPAVNSTNIKFSLASSSGVSIQIMDVAGRTINTIKKTSLAAGEHIIPVNTSGMPAGDYLYLIYTSAGDGMAGKMTIIR